MRYHGVSTHILMIMLMIVSCPMIIQRISWDMNGLLVTINRDSAIRKPGSCRRTGFGGHSHFANCSWVEMSWDDLSWLNLLVGWLVMPHVNFIFYHLDMTNSSPWKDPPLLRTVNHLFRLGPWHPWLPWRTLQRSSHGVAWGFVLSCSA